MVGVYCTKVQKFERDRLFRRHCIGCVHNTAHCGDAKLHCRFLEFKVIYPNKKGDSIPARKPTIRIPADLRG